MQRASRQHRDQQRPQPRSGGKKASSAAEVTGAAARADEQLRVLLAAVYRGCHATHYSPRAWHWHRQAWLFSPQAQITDVRLKRSAPAAIREERPDGVAERVMHWTLHAATASVTAKKVSRAGFPRWRYAYHAYAAPLDPDVGTEGVLSDPRNHDMCFVSVADALRLFVFRHTAAELAAKVLDESAAPKDNAHMLGLIRRAGNRDAAAKLEDGTVLGFANVGGYRPMGSVAGTTLFLQEAFAKGGHEMDWDAFCAASFSVGCSVNTAVQQHGEDEANKAKRLNVLGAPGAIRDAVSSDAFVLQLLRYFLYAECPTQAAQDRNKDDWVSFDAPLSVPDAVLATFHQTQDEAYRRLHGKITKALRRPELAQLEEQPFTPQLVDSVMSINAATPVFLLRLHYVRRWSVDGSCLKHVEEMLSRGVELKTDRRQGGAGAKWAPQTRYASDDNYKAEQLSFRCWWRDHWRHYGGDIDEDIWQENLGSCRAAVEHGSAQGQSGARPRVAPASPAEAQHNRVAEDALADAAAAAAAATLAHGEALPGNAGAFGAQLPGARATAAGGASGAAAASMSYAEMARRAAASSVASRVESSSFDCL
jgi:hypothetical protein